MKDKCGRQVEDKSKLMLPKEPYGNIHSRAYGLHVLRFWMYLRGGYNMMLLMVYLGRTLKLMQNGLRTTGIGYNTVKMRFMCM